VLSAQEAKPAPIHFTVFAAQPLPGLAFLPPKGAAQPMKFALSARSPRYTYAGPPPLKFIEVATGKEVAEAIVPAAVREALLVFSAAPPGEPHGWRYEITVVDDSATQVAPGRFAILNLSGLKLTGTFDRTPIMVSDGMNPPAVFTHPATLTLFTLSHGVKVQSYSEVVRTPKSSRLLLVLFPPARKGALELQSRPLVDVPPVESRR
jgi:hypothetical protein